MSTFEFINHSSFCLKKNNTTLVVDPWIEGTVFNNSWDLLTKTPKESLETVKNADYIWFSHEHPDHFNPPNIKKFAHNKNFIFQKTKDKRVINFLMKYSNNVKELSYNDTLFLDDDFSIRVIPFQDLDSFCIIKIGDKTILNLNDCDIKNDIEINQIKKFSGSIDILLAQFSYAIGKSNKDQSKIRELLSNNILENLSHTISILKPKYFIPFASFCYFSKFDNFYLNDSINKVDTTINFLKKNNPDVNFLCFYPGDKWNFKSPVNNTIAFSKYHKDYNSISPNKLSTDNVNYDKLKDVAEKFIKKTKKKNNLFFYYNLFNNKYYSIYFKLTDIKIYLHFDFKNGLTKINNIDSFKQYCELSSDSLYQLFSSGYGYDALMIGGRYEANHLGNKCLNKIFKFQTKNYQNHYYNYSNILNRIIKKFSKFSRILPER
jgi:UDP-MurNAc hydroxylase